MLQATLEDVAARGLSDAITFKALSTGIKTVGKVRNILQERNLAKQSLRFAQLMTEDSPANVIAITKHESYAQDLRNAWRRAIDRIRNPHTEVVTTEGIVVKVPVEKGNIQLMESGSKGGKRTVEIITPEGQVVKKRVNTKQVRGKLHVTEEFVPKKALPEKIVNKLANYKTERIHIGEFTYTVDKKALTHYCERHAVEFWDGSLKGQQSFFHEGTSVSDINNAIKDVINQNRDIVLKNGTNQKFQITGTYKGREWKVGFKEGGRIGQIYNPKSIFQELADFKTMKFSEAGHYFTLDNKALEYILESGHKTFLKDKFKMQLLLPENFTIQDITNAIDEIISQNYNTILNNGTKRSYQITGTYKDTDILIGFRRGGAIGQFQRI